MYSLSLSLSLSCKALPSGATTQWCNMEVEECVCALFVTSSISQVFFTNDDVISSLQHRQANLMARYGRFMGHLVLNVPLTELAQRYANSG